MSEAAFAQQMRELIAGLLEAYADVLTKYGIQDHRARAALALLDEARKTYRKVMFP